MAIQADKTKIKHKKTRPLLGIYVHIPFCRSKCAYCDFCSYTGTDKRIVEHYVNSIILQAEDFASQCKGYDVDSIYFGGGTPSMLSASQITRIIDCLMKLFRVHKNAEITVEVNPATVNGEYFKKLLRAGVNRLSIGMQSANNNELKLLGRIHTFEDFEKTYDAARAMGFDNISVDVMYGIPDQTMSSFVKTIEHVKRLAPQHVSFYPLKLEEETPMYKMRDSYKFPSDEEQYDMYCEAIRRLKDVGIEPYEISNFSLAGYESIHNIKYWLGQEYIGLGVAAHSYFQSERFEATKNLKTYIYAMELVKKKIPIFVSYEKIEHAEAAKEFFILGMRLYEGIDREEFETRFGADLASRYLEPLKDYVEGGYVRIKGNEYAFTEKGMFLSDYILSDILEIFERSENGNTSYED